MAEGLTGALGLAIRTAAAPLLIGARLASRWRSLEPQGVPASRRGLGVASKIALDEFFFATELAAAPFFPLREHRRVLWETHEALEFYEERGWIDDPRGFHLEPPAAEQAVLERARSPWLPLQHLRFESGYEPHPGEPGRERWLDRVPNRTAHAWLLEHPDHPRPWLVCIPGYRMGHPLVDFVGFKARWLHWTLGLNVAIPVMPLHGPRRAGRRGGDGFFSGDFVDTIHAEAQGVWDVRRLVGWLQDRGAPAVGAYGVSLGGYTTALVASLQDGLACVIAGIPATDFARLVRSNAPDLVLRAARVLGFSFERIERLLRVISPLALQPRVPHARRYLYAGLADRLTSPEHARDLWNHWGRPRVAWYHGGHVSFLWEPEVNALLREAFHDAGWIPPERA